MDVKLISLTKPVDELLMENSDELVAFIARVSNPENQMNHETAPRLLNYLTEHKHWSPYEMVDFTVEIKTSRAIAAQILRHRSFCFQEFSQRYSAATEIEPIELRKKAEKNRQSSTEVVTDPVINNIVKYATDHAVQTYDKLLKQGIAREQARMVLPLTTQTTMYMKGSLRSWIHYIDLRTKEDTQKEHRLIAEKIKNIFIDQFPILAEAIKFKKDNKND